MSGTSFTGHEGNSPTTDQPWKDNEDEEEVELQDEEYHTGQRQRSRQVKGSRRFAKRGDRYRYQGIDSSDTDDSGSEIHPIVDRILFCFACIQFHFINHRLEAILCSILILLALLAITGIVEVIEHRHFRKQQKSLLSTGVLADFTEIQSKYDLKIASIDHWCLGGGFENCVSCMNPLEPQPGDQPHWRVAHEKNIHMIKHFYEAYGTSMGSVPKDDKVVNSLVDVLFDDDDDNVQYPYQDDMTDDLIHKQVDAEHKFTPTEKSKVQDPMSLVDVVFLGDTFAEVYSGRITGTRQEELMPTKQNFENKFHKSKGGQWNGLALGIHLDTTVNLLWRIMNGEIPSNLSPKVFWITIGSRDLYFNLCSEDVTLMGILRVVEEIRNLRPNAIIVINSIPPLSFESDGFLEGVRPHKKNPGRHVNYWKAVKSVNENLRIFSTKHDNIEYFDATEIISYQNGNTKYTHLTPSVQKNMKMLLSLFPQLMDAQVEKIRTLIPNTTDVSSQPESGVSSTHDHEIENDEYFDEAVDNTTSYYDDDHYYGDVDDFTDDFFENYSDDDYFAS